DKSLNLISVGRLEGEKGHRDLIEAISLIDFDVEVTIIGDGSLKESLENYSNELRVNAKFVGAVTDRDYLFELLASSDIFVIPSHTEGMPRSLLEAMAIGLPCLGTSVGGIPEVLDSNMLFSPNDPNSCARKISELISNKSLIEMQSKRNIDFIRKNYSKKSLDEKKIKFWSELYR
ncbi:glycosyltransferase family 4 protein, partial [Cutibacterium acnes]